MSIFVPTRAFEGAGFLDALLRIGRRPKDAPLTSEWTRDERGRLVRRWRLGDRD